jgi:hypothetical protein
LPVIVLVDYVCTCPAVQAITCASQDLPGWLKLLHCTSPVRLNRVQDGLPSPVRLPCACLGERASARNVEGPYLTYKKCKIKHVIQIKNDNKDRGILQRAGGSFSCTGCAAEPCVFLRQIEGDCCMPLAERLCILCSVCSAGQLNV